MPNAEFVYVKEFTNYGEIVLAVCDEEVLGVTLEEGGVKLYVDPAFYLGRRVSLDEAMDLVERSTVANIVGRRAVEEAVRRGLICRDAVKYVQGVPHAQVIKVE
ncbi:MAG: DUF424 family protein [Desulfurococcaceae archaeon]